MKGPIPLPHHHHRRQGIVSDLFPGVVLPNPDYEQLTIAMKKQCVIMNLQPTDYFLMKTIQLYEMIVVRHGLMTVGQPFSGKSRSMQVSLKPLRHLIRIQIQILI